MKKLAKRLDKLLELYADDHVDKHKDFVAVFHENTYTDAEKALLAKVNTIRQEYKLTKNQKLLDDNQELLDKAHEIVLTYVFGTFKHYILMGFGDPNDALDDCLFNLQFEIYLTDFKNLLIDLHKSRDEHERKIKQQQPRDNDTDEQSNAEEKTECTEDKEQ